MRTKYLFIVTVIITAISCNGGKTEIPAENAVENHETENVVVLNENQQNALNLKTGTIQMRNITTLVKTNGELEVPPASSADVTAVIGGNVREILVFDGDKVKKGQSLAILEHPDYITLQEDFSETANRLEFLEKEYLRQKELFENNVGAGKDFQQAKADYNTAKSRFQGLRSRLELLNLDPTKVREGDISKEIRIVAPIDGYINNVNIKVGTYADASSRLFSISDNTAIHADFMVYEKDVHLLRIGQKIDFTVSNRPGEELTATIFAIGKEFEANTRAVHIHARLDKKVENLIPGMYTSGHIHTDINLTQTLPNDAVVTEGTKSYIFIVDNEAVHAEEIHPEDEEGKESGDNEHGDESTVFRMVEVITGQVDDGYTEIKLLDPLPEDTRIVLNMAYYLLADMNKEETEHAH